MSKVTVCDCVRMCVCIRAYVLADQQIETDDHSSTSGAFALGTFCSASEHMLLIIYFPLIPTII